jgi:hypothetical protein
MLSPGDFSPEDITRLTELCNTVDIDEAIDFVRDGDHLAEEAWLTAVLSWMEHNFGIYVMIAYARAHGELESMQLTLPEVEDD